MQPSTASSKRHLGNELKVAVLILIVLSVFLVYFNRPVPSKERVEERTFILRFSITYKSLRDHTWNLTEEDYTVGLFGNNSWQTVYLVNSSRSIRSFKNDEDGNRIAILDLSISHVFPNTTLSYDVEYRIITRPRSIPDLNIDSSLTLSDIPEAMRERFAKLKGPWQVNDPEIVSLAQRIAGNETNVLAIIREFIKWIRDNIRYKTGDIPRYPNETLKERSGDCDDQANLLITFSRIYGIPAHLQVGCIYLPSKANETFQYWNGSLTTVLSRIGWHGWAMVYVPPWGWLPVDLTYAKDMSKDPLNAIKKSAITLQETVQYLNITTTDYIALSINLKNLLRDHSFLLYEYDEMKEESTVAVLSEGSMFSARIRESRPSQRPFWRRLINEEIIQ